MSARFTEHRCLSHVLDQPVALPILTVEPKFTVIFLVMDLSLPGRKIRNKILLNLILLELLIGEQNQVEGLGINSEGSEGPSLSVPGSVRPVLDPNRSLTDFLSFLDSGRANMDSHYLYTQGRTISYVV